MKRIFALISLFSILFTFPGHGQVNGHTDVGNVSSVVVNECSSSGESRITKMPRGRLLSLATLQISDEGRGVLGVYADTLCHTAVKELHMVIYLDIWNEANNDWQSVNVYRYDWLASDYPDQEISMAVVAFDVTGLNRRREYRLRGLHSAKGFDSTTETMSSETDMIFLD